MYINVEGVNFSLLQFRIVLVPVLLLQSACGYWYKYCGWAYKSQL